jgi:hypothetical protein
MSYPPGSPFGYADPLESARAPARTASLMMWIFGPLLLLAGCCCLTAGAVYSNPEVQQSPQYQERISKLEHAEQVMPLVINGCFAGGGLYLLLALVFTPLAFIVRRGTKGPVTVALVVTVVAAAILILQSLLMCVAIAGGNCFSIIPGIYCGLLCIPLFQARKRADLVGQWTDYYARTRFTTTMPGMPPMPAVPPLPSNAPVPPPPPPQPPEN